MAENTVLKLRKSSTAHSSVGVTVGPDLTFDEEVKARLALVSSVLDTGRRYTPPSRMGGLVQKSKLYIKR